MPQDIMLDENNDLDFANGDFAIDESTYQHQRILMTSDKGCIKESPTACVGASRFIEDYREDDFAREIRSDFSADGMKVKKVNIQIPSTIEVEAYYE